MKNKPLIIGVDGGASKVSAYEIEVLDDVSYYQMGRTNSTKEYSAYSGFKKEFTPVDLAVQLAQIKQNNVRSTEAEKDHAQAYYSAFRDVITEIIQAKNTKTVLIGIGMPGVKTADKRGIIAMANGPRMPDFATEIEQRLSKSGIRLAQPISKLGSDADFCGIGEEYGERGAFRGIYNAYYLGGGTGAADALKLNGSLISFDECKAWIAKTWEYCDQYGNSIERYCSANGIQTIYASLTGKTQTELNYDNIYLEQILKRATSSEKAAIDTWQSVSEKIAKLLFERISTIYSGWQNNFAFIDPDRKPIETNHRHTYTLLERIIIGQRLGIVLSKPGAKTFFLEPLKENLSELLHNSGTIDARAKTHYLHNGKFKDQLIVPSRLREASALGAGIAAWKTYSDE